ncbi:trehalose/maltose transport system substrate-binding protein [Natronocella acetinitrilica]|uniref:Trehalose/maltose transport system substrate-binding protein n=1 Tax=Natronocella acetinitrilica TaxID=414046 RepID=A0AAE3G321_9GAMM|nr:ABC transporter substrate-binding protein [Natronocella acetinitrilica]MCP1674895.1 trehalose/maltose transport system substrate-binding protein [Natronocella acetinitrilica]
MKAKRNILVTCGALAMMGMTAPASASVTISISCGAVGQELELCREGADAWAEKTGNQVEIVSTPNSTTERLALYQQILSAEARDIDVYQIDVIWPGILGDHFIDLADYAGDAIDGHFEAIVENNTMDGRLIAMPWFTDAGVLYYREDLLEKHGESVPETWSEMAEVAERIQNAEREEGNSRMWGFVFQGRGYEGLTCNALEWVASYGGGNIVEADGQITINNDEAAAALSEAASWIERISPQGVLNYAEEEARGVFQSGNAVFMRNWPYAWSLAQSEDSPIRGNVGVTTLPHGGGDNSPAAVLGGWQLAVAKYSEHQEEAADLVMFLTSYEEQKRRAIQASYNPTIEALYENDEVLEAVPFFGELYETFVNAVPRPSTVTGEEYNRVSSAFYNAVHDVLRGRAEPEARLGQLHGEYMRMSRGGNW